MLNRLNLSTSHQLSQTLRQFLVVITLSSAPLITACGSSNSTVEEVLVEDTSTETPTELTDTNFDVTDWTEESHSKNVP